MEFPVYVPHSQIWGIYLSFHLSLGIDIIALNGYTAGRNPGFL